MRGAADRIEQIAADSIQLYTADFSDVIEDSFQTFTYIRYNAYIHTYIHTYIHPTYIHDIHTLHSYITYIHYIHTLHTYIHTSIHTLHSYISYIHPYVHTYITFIQFMHTCNKIVAYISMHVHISSSTHLIKPQLLVEEMSSMLRSSTDTHHSSRLLNMRALVLKYRRAVMLK